MMRAILLFTACMITWISSSAQSVITDEELADKFESYSRLHPPGLLFVHTDKTLYTNNETIWLSAYLVGSGTKNTAAHTTLNVALVRMDNRKVFLRTKYLMTDGLSFGSLALPDSIPPGNYRLIAFTNVTDKAGQPLAHFTQTLTIKSITQHDLALTVSLLDTAINNGSIRVQVNVTGDYSKARNKPVLEYTLGETKKAIVLKEPSLLIDVPAGDLTGPQPVLLTSLRFNNQVQYTSLRLPESEPAGIDIRFFPEGGSLADGLESIVGWEAKTRKGLPIALSGILFRDGQAIDTVSTNSYGIGKFSLRPESGSRYALRVNLNAYLKTDSVYSLPASLNNGLVIRIAEAVADDSLRMEVFSATERNVRVLVHNYREVFASFLTPAGSAGARLKIALPGVPKGVSTITVLSESGQPLAERLFFAHYNRKIRADIRFNKQDYKKRDSVKVNIKLANQAGLPARAIVSVAAVQDNRLEGGKQQDIESYVYLNHELGRLPRNPARRAFSDRAYLEDIFLIKGWRRFTWPDLMNSTGSDTTLTTAPRITGSVRFNKKALSDPVSLTVMRDSVFTLMTTESDGTFTIDQDNFLLNDGRKALVSVNEKNKDPYTIEVYDPFIPIAGQLAEQTEIEPSGLAKRVSSTDQQLSGLDKVISLGEVVVNGDKSGGLYGQKGKRGPNACGDYVDEWGFLNYPYSAGRSNNTQPIPGKVYSIRTDIKGYGPASGHTFKVKRIVYSGCMEEANKTIFNIEGIYYAREFYTPRPDDMILSEPLMLSTLFWRPGIITGTQGETAFSFPTGDITGKFRLVIQGVSESDLVFGEAEFDVK